jgi:23S rRNA pseudouridine1911/1915/1917 synthase
MEKRLGYQNQIIKIVPPDTAGRLDQFAHSCIGDFSRSYVQKLIKEGHVFVNHKQIRKNNYPVKENDQIEITIPQVKEIRIQPEQMNLDILYEDKDLILINKPKDMVVHPAPGHYEHTLVNGLLYHCKDNLSGINGEYRPGIVHRIDKDTTGIVIACKNDNAHQSICRQLSEHTITRKYKAIVCHNLKNESGTIDAPIGRSLKDRKKMAVVKNTGRRAVTHYQVRSHLNEKFNYIECTLETGRTHQIRVHMASIGHPILGDTVYGSIHSKFKNLDSQVLHAEILGFVHPTQNTYMEFRAPLPSYFVELLRKIELF